VELVYETLEGLGVKTLLLHGAQAEFDPVGALLIVTVGGDGTLLAASHHVNEVPLLGVNSAPRYSVGFFCAARGKEVPTMLRRALEGKLPSVKLSRMAVAINGQRRSSRVLNEALFCHAIPAATSRYIVRYGDDTEEQRSSGVWVGTAAGSTAATRSAGGKVLPFASRNLQLVIREPYAESKRTVHLNHIIFDPTESLELLSKMEDARLYLDGPYRQIPVGLGDRVIFSVSDEPLHVFGLGRRRDGSRSSQFPRAVVPSPGAAAAGKRAKKPKQSS
jgi:NAD+ kinase